MPHWTEEFFVENPELFAPDLRGMADQADDEVRGLQSLLAEKFDWTPETLLDVGCGLGRHVHEFAVRGVDGTGVDISPAYVAEARERAEAHGVADRTAFVEGDMRNLESLARVEGSHDLVTCLFNTFGYYDEETNLSVLRGMRRQTSTGGACVVQTWNRDGLVADFDDAVVSETEAGLVSHRYDFDSGTGRLAVTRDVLSGDPETTDEGHPDLQYAGRVEYDVRAYTPQELVARFEDAGFEEVRSFSGYDGVEPTADRLGLVVVGR